MRLIERFSHYHSLWKSLKVSHINFSILAFSINFCPTTIDLFVTLFDSPFLAFLMNLSTQNVNVCSSLHSQCWMRLLGWFSNTVKYRVKNSSIFRVFWKVFGWKSWEYWNETDPFNSLSIASLWKWMKNDLEKVQQGQIFSQKSITGRK